MHQVRAVTLSGYVELAAAVGLDPDRMLKEAGLKRQALADPENRLPALAVVRLLELSAERSGCDSFGLRLAVSRSFASLGPLSLLLEHLPNPREVVRAAIEFQRLLNDIVAISMEDAGELYLVRIDLVPGHWGVQTSDFVIATAYKVLAEASGQSWRPSTVHVIRKVPIDIEAWRQLFHAPLEFASDFNGFSCTREAMLSANPRADAAMAANARRLLQLMPVDALPSPLTERVRRTVAALLPAGRMTIDAVAAQLGMSRRSLQRGLRREDQRFGALLDNIRCDLAIAYLADSAHPVTSVAAMLGYRSPSAFTRWFAGAFGMSPQAWRKANGAQRASAGAASGKNGIATSNSRPSPSRKV